MADVLNSDNPVLQVSHREMANAVRVLSMDAVQAANSGHPGLPMGMADVATVLFTRFLKFDVDHPDWPARDRFILSAGHGSMLQYALLYLTGSAGMDIEDIKNFRQLGSKTAGHPEYGHTVGVETTTGPLGQGLANAVGMAIAERHMSEKFGEAICGHQTYVVAGDGCLMEGISHEAISMAGHLGLGNLITLFDDNKISIDGPTDITVSDDQLERFEASGWHVASVDGHDEEAIALAIQNAKNITDRPSMIACRSIIGYGAPNKQGTAATHGAALGHEEISEARKYLEWDSPPFEIPQAVLANWRIAGKRCRTAYENWQISCDRLSETEKSQLTDPIDGRVKSEIATTINDIKTEFATEKPKLASRVSSQQVLERLVPIVPGLIGGSADLTGSNGTLTSHHHPLTSQDYSGTYINYGVREHGMAAAMNGMALHGGIVPYGATFLVFTDYCRPAIRLSSLMGLRVIYVMTHDSIGLGEDGPTHQPVEHLAALRSIPNLNVLRPADAVECAECWEIALNSVSTPTILVLTRQGLPPLRQQHSKENLSARGAYVIHETDGPRDVTLLATGSEVAIAMEASQELAKENIIAAVVSMPCWELFEHQSARDQKAVLGSAPRVACEAAVEFGWQKWLGDDGLFVGMSGFGASAPGDTLYEHFNITTNAVVKNVIKLIS